MFCCDVWYVRLCRNRCSRMEKFWTEIWAVVNNEEITAASFFGGIKVWIERPHIINRKLSAAVVLNSWTLRNVSLVATKSLEDFFQSGEFTYEETVQLLESLLLKEKALAHQADESHDGCNIAVILRRLLPRNFEKFTHVFEVAVVDDDNKRVTFYPRSKDTLCSKIAVSFPYRFKFSQNRIALESYKIETEIGRVDQLSEEWLKSSVLPKIIKWSRSQDGAQTVASLRLVCAKSYAEKYFYLKCKYGKHFIEIWPESTDPKKHVYEDIAIAAYLMTLWEAERSRLNLSSMQSFVDVGCGNGLLVHILRSEGYPGMGIDVRRRKIWELYGPDTSLIEQSISDPSSMRFPEHSWLIGNHSDELTPWIPIIAARSSYEARAFLLPCCAFTFNGKFERSDAKVPQYESYLRFVSEVCSAAGFEVRRDKLRIPSTKRICFVCSSRTYKREEEQSVEDLRTAFISSKSKRSAPPDNVPACSSDVPEFVPRSPVESVRNCSQLDKSFLDRTVVSVLNILLGTCSRVPAEEPPNSPGWNVGGELTLRDLVSLLGPEISQKMKKQCGGLQTFLRNYKSVFQVSSGTVRLRVPSANNEWMQEKRRWKQPQVDALRKKKCYFHYHHPQGCPLSEDLCTFSHCVK